MEAVKRFFGAAGEAKQEEMEEQHPSAPPAQLQTADSSAAIADTSASDRPVRPVRLVRAPRHLPELVATLLIGGVNNNASDNTTSSSQKNRERGLIMATTVNNNGDVVPTVVGRGGREAPALLTAKPNTAATAGGGAAGDREQEAAELVPDGSFEASCAAATEVGHVIAGFVALAPLTSPPPPADEVRNGTTNGQPTTTTSPPAPHYRWKVFAREVSTPLRSADSGGVTWFTQDHLAKAHHVVADDGVRKKHRWERRAYTTGSAFPFDTERLVFCGCMVFMGWKGTTMATSQRQQVTVSCDPPLPDKASPSLTAPTTAKSAVITLRTADDSFLYNGVESAEDNDNDPVDPHPADPAAAAAGGGGDVGHGWKVEEGLEQDAKRARTEGSNQKAHSQQKRRGSLLNSAATEANVGGATSSNEVGGTGRKRKREVKKDEAHDVVDDDRKPPTAQTTSRRGRAKKEEQKGSVDGDAHSSSTDPSSGTGHASGGVGRGGPPPPSGAVRPPPLVVAGSTAATAAKLRKPAPSDYQLHCNDNGSSSSNRNSVVKACSSDDDDTARRAVTIRITKAAFVDDGESKSGRTCRGDVNEEGPDSPSSDDHSTSSSSHADVVSAERRAFQSLLARCFGVLPSQVYDRYTNPTESLVFVAKLLPPTTTHGGDDSATTTATTTSPVSATVTAPVTAPVVGGGPVEGGAAQRQHAAVSSSSSRSTIVGFGVMRVDHMACPPQSPPSSVSAPSSSSASEDGSSHNVRPSSNAHGHCVVGSDDVAALSWIVVEPKYRCMGVATALGWHMCRHAVGCGARTIDAIYIPGQEPLLRQLGFHSVKRSSRENKTVASALFKPGKYWRMEIVNNSDELSVVPPAGAGAAATTASMKKKMLKSGQSSVGLLSGANRLCLSTPAPELVAKMHNEFIFRHAEGCAGGANGGSCSDAASYGGRKAWNDLVMSCCDSVPGDTLLKSAWNCHLRIVAIDRRTGALAGLIAVDLCEDKKRAANKASDGSRRATGAEGWTDFLACSPEHRSKGLGAVLLFAGLEWLRLQGAAHMDLSPLSNRVAAFYTRWGFARINVAKRGKGVVQHSSLVEHHHVVRRDLIQDTGGAEAGQLPLLLPSCPLAKLVRNHKI